MKKVLAFLLASAMVVGLAACGGTASSTASEPAKSTTSSVAGGSESTTGGQAGGRTLDEIKASGKLVMMTNATFPPYEYHKDSGIQGVDVALAQMVADELGVELEVLDMNFDLLIAALQGGKGDLVAAGMSITDERKTQVDFSIPYVDATLLIVVPEGSEITGPNDLVGKKIAVQENTTSDLYVTDNVDGAEVMRFKSAVDAGNTVVSGKADVAVIDELTAKSIVNNSDGKLTLLEEPLGQEQYAMAVQKGNAELLNLVNEVLQKAIDDGKVDSLIAEHMDLAKE